MTDAPKVPNKYENGDPYQYDPLLKWLLVVLVAVLVFMIALMMVDG
jgi:hypothetical protein